MWTELVGDKNTIPNKYQALCIIIEAYQTSHLTQRFNLSDVQMKYNVNRYIMTQYANWSLYMSKSL